MLAFTLCAAHSYALHQSSARLVPRENEVAGLLSHGRFPKRASEFQNGHGAHSVMRDKGRKKKKKSMGWWGTLWLIEIGGEEYEGGGYFSEWAASGKINVRWWHMCKYARAGMGGSWHVMTSAAFWDICLLLAFTMVKHKHSQESLCLVFSQYQSLGPHFL